MNDLTDQFRLAIAAAGLTPPTEIIDDGVIHRFSTSGKPTHKNGWYMLHTDGIAAGAFGDWREGFTQNWCSKADTSMTEAERFAHRERVKAMQRQREDDLAQRQQLAAADALKRWAAATPCTEHDYLTRKGIQPHGAKIEGDKLLIPMRDTAGKGAREAVRDLFDRLAVFDPVQDGAAPHDDFVKLPHFCFDDAAQDIFVEWCTELHTVHIANEQNPLMQQHFGKFEKLFCAVALILHLAEGSIGPVSVNSALRAASWCEYLSGHAQRIYGLVEAANVTTARTVSRRLADGKLDDGFTVRDMVRNQWSGVTTAMQAEAVLSILEKNGHVQSQDSGNLGRPTVRYYINPRIKKVSK